MNHKLELKLQAWVDGELSAAEALGVEREVAAEAEARQLVVELRAVKNAFMGAETILAVPETREFYWSKIARQIERDDRVPHPAPTGRPPIWIRWLSPAAGIIGLACMVVLAVRPFSPPAFDEISSTGEGMEAVTYHDQSTGMTIVWLADSEQAQAAQTQTQIQTTAPSTQDTKTTDMPDPEVEME